jgi:hypothetical protein
MYRQAVCMLNFTHDPTSDARMEFDVTPFRDLHGRWHRRIRFKMRGHAGPAAACGGCHEERAGVACMGFQDWDAAAEDGWRAVRQLISGKTLGGASRRRAGYTKHFREVSMRRPEKTG